MSRASTPSSRASSTGRRRSATRFSAFAAAGGPHAPPAGARTRPDFIRPLDRANTRRSTEPAARSSTRSRTNPAQMRRARLPALARRDGVTRERPTAFTTSRRWCSTTSPSSASTTWCTIGGDDTLSFARALHRRGRSAHRDPQDDGQRRPGHRVLHRLLHGDHARQGADQPPAHHAGLARAHRGLPHLRPRLRLLGALHGLRHVRPLRHPRSALRPRAA